MPKTRETMIAHLQGREKLLEIVGFPNDRPNGSPWSTCTRACSTETSSPSSYRGPTASTSGDALKPC